MKFEFPSTRTVAKIVIISFLLSFVAYIIAAGIEMQEVSASRLLAYGALAGALAGGLLSSIKFGPLFAASRQSSLFVGNLAFKTSANELRNLFEQYGTVHNVRLMTDRATRRPKGFGFVDMDKKGAQAAMADLNGYEFKGRELKINLAHRRSN